jgi:hypothetical protein
VARPRAVDSREAVLGERFLVALVDRFAAARPEIVPPRPARSSRGDLLSTWRPRVTAFARVNERSGPTAMLSDVSSVQWSGSRSRPLRSPSTGPGGAWRNPDAHHKRVFPQVRIDPTANNEVARSLYGDHPRWFAPGKFPLLNPVGFIFPLTSGRRPFGGRNAATDESRTLRFPQGRCRSRTKTRTPRRLRRAGP